jgi:hypothetical protein
MQVCSGPVYHCSMDDLAPLVVLDQARWGGPWPDSAASALEQGAVLHFRALAFDILPGERRFLSAQWSDGDAKNISFDPASRNLKGARIESTDSAELAQMMARFATAAHDLVLALAPHYGSHLSTGRTSFRPVEIEGRPPLSWRKDDRRLHTDAFPSQPTGGSRILRVFANVDPEGRARLWRTGETFERLTRVYGPRIRPPLPGSAALLEALHITKARRSPYDHYMLRLHDLAKGDDAYQAVAPRREIAFPPSVWMVFTDQCLHAALAGRNALEQTFYLPVAAQRHPELAPLSVLERLTGRRLAAA